MSAELGTNGSGPRTLDGMAGSRGVLFTSARWRRGGDLQTAAFKVVSPTLAWLFAGYVCFLATWTWVSCGWVGGDAHAYWLAGRTAHPYGGTPGRPNAFLYTPVFAQAMRVLAGLPFPVFAALVMVASSVTYWWLARPLVWWWRAPVLMVCWTEVLTGNIHAFLAAALVVGVMRRGEALSLPALTKQAPAGVGVLWHLCRGEWRPVVRASVASLVLVGVSWLLSPELWGEWFRFVTSSSGAAPGNLWVRVAVGLALAVYAATSNRPGLLAVAYWLTLPMAGFRLVQPMAVMVAAVRLRGADRQPTPLASFGRTGYGSPRHNR